MTSPGRPLARSFARSPAHRRMVRRGAVSVWAFYRWSHAKLIHEQSTHGAARFSWRLLIGDDAPNEPEDPRARAISTSCSITPFSAEGTDSEIAPYGAQCTRCEAGVENGQPVVRARKGVSGHVINASLPLLPCLSTTGLVAPDEYITRPPVFAPSHDIASPLSSHCAFVHSAPSLLPGLN